MKESDIVRAILRYLKTVPGCFAWKEHGGMYGTAGIPDINGESKMMRARRERSLPGFCIGDDDYAKTTEKGMLISGLSEFY